MVDAKLARSVKARAVLQTAFYSHLLAGVQGAEPRWMHLALGNGEFVPFKVGRALCHLPVAGSVPRAQANRR